MGKSTGEALSVKSCEDASHTSVKTEMKMLSSSLGSCIFFFILSFLFFFYFFPVLRVVLGWSSRKSSL